MKNKEILQFFLLVDEENGQLTHLKQQLERFLCYSEV